MTQIFTIDESKIERIRIRAFVRGLKILAITFLSMLVLMYPQRAVYFQNNAVWGFLAGMLISVGAVYAGTAKLKANYKTLEIILDDEGVKLKAQMSPYKNISWGNLVVEEKANGSIKLSDSSVLQIERKWNNKGVIVIQPEINDREKLLSELKRKSFNS